MFWIQKSHSEEKMPILAYLNEEKIIIISGQLKTAIFLGFWDIL